jgi:putative nucleotidyltransferase with HDIG domain
MPEAKVLAVDDEPSILSLVERVLVKQGYKVKSASSAQNALEILTEEKFDLLLTDIVMPGMDGLELLQKVRERRPDITAVIITGHATLDFAIKSLNQGAQGFIVKPFTAEELNIAIKEALMRSQLMKENVRLRAFMPLFEVSKTLLSEVRLSKLFNLIVDTLIKETKSDRVSLMLLDEEKQELCIKAARGLPQGIIDSQRVKVGEDISGQVAKTGNPLIIPDQLPQDPQIQNRLNKAEIVSALCLPLTVRDRVIGVLNLARLSGGVPFTPSDLEFASILCGQIALALENAKLNEDLTIRLKEREEEKRKLEQQMREIIALNRFFQTQQDRLIELNQSYRQLETLYLETLKAVMLAIERKLNYFPGHSEYSAKCILPLAEAMGLPTEGLAIAAYLHDVGMITVPSEILLKRGTLTPQEWELVKQHVVAGERILEGIDLPKEVRSAVRHHHEHYDGSGYPDGLSRDNIPISARLLAVIDSYESLMRTHLGSKVALAELQDFKGKKYDPQVVDIFIQLASEGTIRPPENL